MPIKLKKIIGLYLAAVALPVGFCITIFAHPDIEQTTVCQEQTCDKIEDNTTKSNLDKALEYIMKTSVIQSEKITLTKKFEKEDKEILAEYFSNEDVHKYFWIPSVVNFESKKDVLERWENIDKNESLSKQVFVIKNFENNPVGILEFNYLKEENQINLGCWIGHKFWGNQYAEEAVFILAIEIYKFKPQVTFSFSFEERNKNSKNAFIKGFKILDKMGINYSLEEGYSDVKIEVVPIESDSENVMVEITHKNETIVKSLTPKEKIKWHILKDNKHEIKFLNFKIKAL